MKKKRGSTLILVLLVASVLMILGTSLLAVTSSTYTMENAVDNTNKLNDMAESGMEVAMAQVENINSSASSAAFTDISGLKSDDGTITCNVRFYKDQEYDNATKTYINASGKYTIESTASNSKGAKTIRAVISNSVSSAPPSTTPTSAGVQPGNYIIFLNGSGASGFGQCSIDGDVYVNGDFNLSQGSKINGEVVVVGNSSITGSGNTTNGLVGFGSVTLGNSGTVNGDVNCKGNLIMPAQTNSRVYGNAKSDGSLDMSNGGSASISGDVTIGGSASFSGGNNIQGKLYYQGSVSYSYGSASTFVPKGIVKTTSYTPIDLSGYTSPTLQTIAIPTNTQNPQLYNNVTLNNNTINSSGKLTSSTFSSIGYGSTISIDTSIKDISLLVDNFNFSPQKGLNFEVSGPHNLYIYLKGSSAAFSIGSNQFIGMKDHNAAPQAFIIGDSNQNVNITNNSELDAVIYIPNGKLNASGSNYPTYKFRGSSIVSSVNIDNGVQFKYVKPDFTSTPLEILNSGQSGSDSGSGSDSDLNTNNWIVDNWYN